MGIGMLLLQYDPGENAQTLGRSGHERFTIQGLETIKPGQRVEVEVTSDEGKVTRFAAGARADNETEVAYLHHGGILPLVLRELIAKEEKGRPRRRLRRHLPRTGEAAKRR